MKTFPSILILIVVFFLIRWAIIFSHPSQHIRSTHQCKGDRFSLDKELIPYWDSFIIDAEAHNFNYNHIYCISDVEFGHSHEWQGITSIYKNEGDIRINEHLTQDTVGMKFVFYHELGHWFGLDHGDGIMTESYDSKRDSAYVREHWNELVDDYFQKLKSN